MNTIFATLNVPDLELLGRFDALEALMRSSIVLDTEAEAESVAK